MEFSDRPKNAAQSAAPPHTTLIRVLFDDDTKINQAIDALETKQAAEKEATTYRLAVLAKGSDGRISECDVARPGRGTAVTSAVIGGAAGLAAGGPLGAVIGAGAGALIGLSAEAVNEEAVSEFAEEDWSELRVGRRAILAEIANEAVPAFEQLMVQNGGRVCK